MNAKIVLIEALRAMKADGLCLILVPGEVDCGCGTDDLAPCNSDCLTCVPAKYNPDDDLYYPMEDDER
jgi:hypothetical protein